jgi:hypothetical protein
MAASVRLIGLKQAGGHCRPLSNHWSLVMEVGFEFRKTIFCRSAKKPGYSIVNPARPVKKK